MAGGWNAEGGSGKAGVWGAVEDVAVDEMRRELQEGSLAGDAGRGGCCWRNRGLELGAREELLEELLGLERGKET